MSRIFIKESVNKVGEEVLLKGWVHARRNLGKMVFFELRDMTGLIQVVVPSGLDEATSAAAQDMRPEFVVAVNGVVQARKPGSENEKLGATGSVEILASRLEIINTAKTPPFEIENEDRQASEELRLKYRYLDLRHERMQKNITLRHEVVRYMRNFLADQGFREIETPILGKSTPEGARDYLVPSRLYHGKFYALPQSPQQYKQLLMVAGIERYFQIARCFRDEDTRGDRQPEFTQLDIEMSFVSQEEILQLIEDLYVKIVQTLTPEKRIQQVPFPRLTYKEVIEKYGTDKPDIREDKNDPNLLAFAFVVDFPMFEWKEEEKRWDATHHPFTKPQTDNPAEVKASPSTLLAHQYDFVLNGYEIGGGSIRTHNPELLSAVFETMGHSKEQVKEKFGHLLEAFEFGVPPHGGIAPGIDRFIMILRNEPNIREVIAFPKTADAKDLLMAAPDEVSRQQLKDLGIKTK